MSEIIFKQSGNDIEIILDGEPFGEANYSFDKLGAHLIICSFVNGISYQTKNEGIFFWRKSFLFQGEKNIGSLKHDNLTVNEHTYSFDRRFDLFFSGRKIANLCTNKNKDWSIEIDKEIELDLELVAILCVSFLRPTFGIAGAAV